MSSHPSPRASLARKLRADPTAAEVKLWRALYTLRSTGFHFRKQARIGAYIVDFVCRHAGLVVEVDGNSHGADIARSNDAVRDDYLGGRGFTVLRFSNHDVLTNPDGVFAVIAEALRDRPRNHRDAAPPFPTFPARGEGARCVQP